MRVAEQLSYASLHGRYKENHELTMWQQQYHKVKRKKRTCAALWF